MLSITTSYIEMLEQDGNVKTARLIRRLKANVNRPLAAILTLNTIAHTGGAAGAGAQATSLFGDQYLGIISAIMTVAILVLSEIIPKTLGATYWKQLAPMTAVSLKYMVIILYPFVIMSEFITDRIAKNKGHFKGLNRDELAAMAELSTKEGQLGAKELEIIKNLLFFHTLNVKEIITPRTVVFAADANLTIEEFFQQHGDEKFSRIPIYEDEHENIIGFVLLSDLHVARAKSGGEMRIREMKRPIKGIPESISLTRVFQLFLSRRDQIMLVIDEHGGFEGIVTLEDTLEKLIGHDIVDEYDTTPNMRELAKTKGKKWAKKNKATHFPDS